MKGRNAMARKVIEDFDTAALRMHSGRLAHLIVVAFYNGREHPACCAPFPLDPEPECNMPVNDFEALYRDAVSRNEAVRDGVKLIRVPEAENGLPVLTGWAYGMFAPRAVVPKRRFNRGSGYNSSLDFSCVENVEAVYLIDTKNGVLRFDHGNETELCG